MGESDEESDPDDFIVDESGQPIATKKKHKVKHSDAALQEAQDIFGVDFDFTEFEQYGEEQVRKIGRFRAFVFVLIWPPCTMVQKNQEVRY